MPEEKSGEQGNQQPSQNPQVQKVPVIDLEPQKVIKRSEDRPDVETLGGARDGQSSAK